MALSQGLFVRVILFLWVTTNVEEIRDNYNKAKGSSDLPRLPQDLDTRLMVRSLPNVNDIEYNVVCLNMKGKVGLFTLVYMPKFIIAAILTAVGCLWLMAAENIGDLILNSLALTFVVKVDELIGRVFFPAKLQEDISDLVLMLPAVPEEKNADSRTILRGWEFVQCSIVLILTGISVELVFRFQPVVPSFANDVGHFCASYIDSHVPWCSPGSQECFPLG